MPRLFDRHLGHDWPIRAAKPSCWDPIEPSTTASSGRPTRRSRRGSWTLPDAGPSRAPPAAVSPRRSSTSCALPLNLDALTIGFARRFATYKRANLVLRDIELLASLVNDPQRPIQFVFAGKAHPLDGPGKEILQEISRLMRDPRFAGKILFVEDYDINVGRHLVQGVDVWLNTPRRPLEASGTSGQKVVLNGGLNCSILDGWWAEAYDGLNGFGDRSGRNAHVDGPARRPRRRSPAPRRARRDHPAVLRPRSRRPARAAGSRG